MKGNPRKEFLYGMHPVHAALSAGRRRVYEIYVAGAGSRKKRFAPIFELAKKAGTRITDTTGEQIERMTGAGAHQGIAAQVDQYPMLSVETLPAVENFSADALLLIADGIVDPHNLGALIRTGACVGVDGVIIPKDNAASPTPAVSKASAGALEYMAVARETNIARTLDRLKEVGFWVAGLDSSGEISVFEANLNGPMALVIGGEDRGIRRLVREKCDMIVSIPQKSTVNSLNASVAGGVAMYEILRQRTSKLLSD